MYNSQYEKRNPMKNTERNSEQICKIERKSLFSQDLNSINMLKNNQIRDQLTSLNYLVTMNSNFSLKAILHYLETVSLYPTPNLVF